MSLLVVLVATLAWGTVSANQARAHGKRLGDLTILHPWTPEAGGPDAVIRMKIRNSGTKVDRLVSAASTAGEVKLTAIPEIAPQAVTELGHSGAHVVLSGLKAKLTGYDRIPVVLTFETAGAVEIEVMVEPRD